VCLLETVKVTGGASSIWWGNCVNWHIDGVKCRWGECLRFRHSIGRWWSTETSGENAACHKHLMACGTVVLVGQELAKFIFCIGSGAWKGVGRMQRGTNMSWHVELLFWWGNNSQNSYFVLAEGHVYSICPPPQMFKDLIAATKNPNVPLASKQHTRLSRSLSSPVPRRSLARLRGQW
jgi:hypothetical protein